MEKEEQVGVGLGGSLAELRILVGHPMETQRPFWGWPGLSETASQPPSNQEADGPAGDRSAFGTYRLMSFGLLGSPRLEMGEQHSPSSSTSPPSSSG